MQKLSESYFYYGYLITRTRDGFYDVTKNSVWLVTQASEEMALGWIKARVAEENARKAQELAHMYGTGKIEEGDDTPTAA